MGKRATKVTKSIKKVRVVYLYIDGADILEDEILLDFFSLSEDILAAEVARKTGTRGVVVSKIIEVTEKYELPLREFISKAQLVYAEDTKAHVLRVK